MRVLVTGATGHLGRDAVRELLAHGHTVRCMVRSEDAGRRFLRRRGTGKAELSLGDIRDHAAVERAVAGQEVVLHLAAVLPPLADRHPALARAVNVGGAETLLHSLQGSSAPPRLVYVSTVALFGNTQALEPPRRIGDPIAPMDAYSQHKAMCEALVRASGLTSTILRLTAVPRFDEGFDPLRMRAMFAIAPTDRMECLHPDDAALALANACSSPDVWGKTLLIAGGPSCRMTLADYYRGYLNALGIGEFAPRYFAKQSYHLDWYDTAESEALLHYQRHSFQDFVDELRRRQRMKRLGVTLVRPLVRRVLLRYAARG